MTERLVLGNTGGLKKEYFTCTLNQYLEKACTTVLNQSGWEKYWVYIFDHDPVWRLRKVDIKASDEAFDAATPLTSPTKSSVPLVDLNANSADALTTDKATELARKHRRAESTSAVQEDTEPGSNLETGKKEEDNNHTGTVFLQDSDLPKNNQNGIRSSDICLVPVRAIGDTVLNVMCGSIDAKGKKAEIEENNRAAIASRNSADISKQMMLGKSTAEKL